MGNSSLNILKKCVLKIGLQFLQRIPKEKVILLCQIKKILGDTAFRVLLAAPCFEARMWYLLGVCLWMWEVLQLPLHKSNSSGIQFAFEKLSSERAPSKLWLLGLKLSIIVSKISIIQPGLRKTSPPIASVEWCPLSQSMLRALCVCGLFLPLPACTPRLWLMAQSIQQPCCSYHTLVLAVPLNLWPAVHSSTVKVLADWRDGLWQQQAAGRATCVQNNTTTKHTLLSNHGLGLYDGSTIYDRAWTWNQQERKGFPRQGAQERTLYYDLPDTFNPSFKINIFWCMTQGSFLLYFCAVEKKNL